MIHYTKLIIINFIFLTLLTSSAYTQDLSTISSSSERDLLEAIDRLNLIRNQISEEKIPMARQITQKENSILDLRTQATRIQAANDSSTIALADIRADLEDLEQEYNFLSSLLDEYAGRFETDLNITEYQTYREQINASNSDNLNDAERDQFTVQIEAINHGFSRIRNALSGNISDGTIISEDGILTEGQIARFGPLVFFHNEEKELNGLVVSSSGGSAHLFADNSGFDNIADLFQGQTTLIPIDVTNGKAISIKTESDGLFDHIRKGGIWIVPILIFAAISIVASIIKLKEINKIKSPEVGIVHNILTLLQKGNEKEAINATKTVSHPIGGMLQQGIKHANSPKDLIEEIMYESMLDTQPKLEKYMSLIAISAATAPLLGLLGTVTGMINTFQLITLFGTGDAQSLSSGISEALITTEFGLIVAIPALIIHALLSRKIQSIMTDMEKYAVIFTNALPRKVAA